MKKGKDFKPDVIGKEFGLPDNLEPVNILAVGYSDEEMADPAHYAQIVPLIDSYDIALVISYPKRSSSCQIYEKFQQIGDKQNRSYI